MDAEEHDDHDASHLMQTWAKTKTLQACLSEVTMAFAVQSLLREATTLSFDDQAIVRMELQRPLRAYDPENVCVHLLAKACRDPPENTRPASKLGERGAALLDQWWGILQSHLPGPAVSVSLDDAAMACAATNEDKDSASSNDVCVLRNSSTQTMGAAATNVLDVLVTSSSSTSQQAAKLPVLHIPTGEAVAITMIASVRPETSSSMPGPALFPCAHAADGVPPHPLPRGVAQGDPSALPALNAAQVHTNLSSDALREALRTPQVLCKTPALCVTT